LAAVDARPVAVAVVGLQVQVGGHGPPPPAQGARQALVEGLYQGRQQGGGAFGQVAVQAEADGLGAGGGGRLADDGRQRAHLGGGPDEQLDQQGGGDGGLPGGPAEGAEQGVDGEGADVPVGKGRL